MRRRTKVLLTAAVAVPLVIGGTGTAYAAHFQSRALPGSTVSGMSVAGLGRAEVARAVRERAADVTVTVTNGDTTEKARLADLGAAVDVDATVDAVFAANRSWSAYATSLLSPRHVDAVVATDPAASGRVARRPRRRRRARHRCQGRLWPRTSAPSSSPPPCPVGPWCRAASRTS